MDIKIKALDPDSEVEVNQLCALYAKSYGEQCRFSSVDADRFWKSRTGNRFTTLVALHAQRCVASVSLRPDRENRSHIQLYMAVCDPDFLERAAEIRTAMTDLIHRLALRQKWQMIYTYQFMQIEQQAWFSGFLLDGIDVAFWPSSLPSGSGNQKKKDLSAQSGVGSVMISQRILQPPAQQKSRDLLLFAPEKHLEFCQRIYSSLGLRFTITSDLKKASREIRSIHSAADKTSHARSAKTAVTSDISDSDMLAVSADRRAIERHSHRQGGFSLCFVEPSLTGSFKDLENALSRSARCADYVALNMLDSKTPYFAEQLEKIGFGFGGVLPLHRNRHTLLYYRTAGSFSWQSVKQQRSLISYLRVSSSADGTESGRKPLISAKL